MFASKIDFLRLINFAKSKNYEKNNIAISKHFIVLSFISPEKGINQLFLRVL